MPKETISLIDYEERTYDDGQPAEVNRYIQLSNLRKTKEELLGLVLCEKPNIDRIQKILSQQFVCERLDTEVDLNYQGGHHTHFRRRGTYIVRPTVEHLFFEDLEWFAILIKNVLQRPSPRLYDTFTNSLKNTDLAGIGSPWDEAKKKQINDGIMALDIYGKKLTDKKVARGEHALVVASGLNQLVSTHVKKEMHAIFWLDLKLDFFRVLHSKDKEFIGYRGYKELISNLALLVFTAGIAHLISGCVAGDWTFYLLFKQPHTQGLISGLDEQSNPRKLLSFSPIKALA